MIMYFPLRVHSHYSLLLSTLKVEDIVEQGKNYGAVGLTDFTSVAGCVSFFKECKNAGVKPILGCELIVGEEYETLTLICKNLSGWKTLLKIISISNQEENFKKHPTIPIEKLKQFDLSNFVCIDGYEGSLLHHEILEDVREGYFIEDYDELGDKCLDRRWEEKGITHISHMKDIFNHYYLECVVEECCSETNPLPIFLSNCVKKLSKITSTKTLVDNPVYYKDSVGAVDHRVLLCARLKCTMSQLYKKIESGNLLDNRLNIFLKSTFFKFNKLPKSRHQEIVDLCEDYDILSQPKLPHFVCPDGQTEMEYLKHLCREGWKNVLKPSGVLTSKEKENEYRDRVLYELDVIERANLAGYFLIVQDYINEFRNRGYLIGHGRGSVGSSIIAYLTRITLIDPIVYDLIFERFYDSSRIVNGKASLPDIDVDFPPEIREDVISYLKRKYGESKVAQIATYGRLQGKSALKEVLRVNEYCSFDEMNSITSCLPNEGLISDQLEEMDEPSIIMWALEHEANKLRDYCYLEDGELKGDYSKAFEQAIRLEGIHKSLGKHACAVIISSEDIDSFCPIGKASRSNEKIILFDMYGVEDAGGVKCDILGLSALTAIQRTCED